MTLRAYSQRWIRRRSHTATMGGTGCVVCGRGKWEPFSVSISGGWTRGQWWVPPEGTCVVLGSSNQAPIAKRSQKNQCWLKNQTANNIRNTVPFMKIQDIFITMLYNLQDICIFKDIQQTSWSRYLCGGDGLGVGTVTTEKGKGGKRTGPYSTGRCLNNALRAMERDGPDEPVVRKKTEKRSPLSMSMA